MRFVQKELNLWTRNDSKQYVNEKNFAVFTATKNNILSFWLDLQHLPPERQDGQRRPEDLSHVHPERFVQLEKKLSGRKTDRLVLRTPVQLSQKQPEQQQRGPTCQLNENYLKPPKSNVLHSFTKM